MAQTVIGVFNSDPAAEEAVQNLLAVGVDRDEIHIHTRPSEIEAMTDSSAEAHGTPKLENESLLDKVERFFATLVGDDGHPPEFYHYREVVRRGGALVSVCVRDESRLPVVFTVFETSGACDIDEHAAQWKMDLQDDASMRSRAIPAPGAPDTAVPGAVTPGASRQSYRVYPDASAARSSPGLSDARSLQSPGKHGDDER